ncbi:hypothetical protein ACWDV7_36215 [Streptomyces sp. NPDC003362]
MRKTAQLPPVRERAGVSHEPEEHHMHAVQPTALATATARLISVWNSVETAEEAAAVLTCGEIDVLAAVFRAAGAPEAAKLWISEHVASSSECDGHDDAERSGKSSDIPAPGTEHPFSISDIARATAQLLGDGWTATSGRRGTSGTVYGPYVASFLFVVVDDEQDLCITFEANYDSDGLPEHPDLPHGVKDYDGGVYVEGASAADGLDTLVARCAAAIRAITGYDPDDCDSESSRVPPAPHRHRPVPAQWRSRARIAHAQQDALALRRTEGTGPREPPPGARHGHTPCRAPAPPSQPPGTG